MSLLSKVAGLANQLRQAGHDPMAQALIHALQCARNPRQAAFLAKMTIDGFVETGILEASILKEAHQVLKVAQEYLRMDDPDVA